MLQTANPKEARRTNLAAPKTRFDGQIHSRGLQTIIAVTPPPSKTPYHWILKPDVEEEDPIQDDDDDAEDNTNIAIAPKSRVYSKLQIRCRANGYQSICPYLENHTQEKDTTRFLSCMGSHSARALVLALIHWFLLQGDDFFFIGHRLVGRNLSKLVIVRFRVGVFVGF